MTKLFEEKMIREIEERVKRWEQEVVPKWIQRIPERKDKFVTDSGIEIKRVYTPADVKDLEYKKDLGFPGEYPFTRGPYPTMYRGRIWTMRQYAGYGTAEETNKRFKYLLSQGQTGLSVAFDLPTQLGYDSDHPLAEGEVGRVGVAISSLKDMEILFDGIPLGKVSTSMTINSTATAILAMYIVTAKKQGFEEKILAGTVQNDILKEYVARGTYIFPPKPSLKLVVDIIEYTTKNMPKWNPISISGYHIREAGANAIQEIAFTFANAIEYVNAAVERGLDVDSFAPRISFFFDVGMYFFEEIAKFRAARRIWAKIMKEKFGAKNPNSMRLRFHAQTGGSFLTAQQPENNIIRVTIQALAAVLGGAQSIHTNAFDEALALPTEKSVKIALRTQQIIAYESGVADVVDPVAGSYFVEWLTNEIEERVWKYLDKIEKMGGAIKAIESGYMQREIANSAYKWQMDVEEGRRVIVGVNMLREEKEVDVPEILKVDPILEERQKARLRDLKASRDKQKVKNLLDEIRKAAEDGKNLMPYMIKAVANYVTLGEIFGVLRDVYGEYKAPTIF